MMSVTRTSQVFTNKCRRCHHKWRAMLEVDLIDWYDETSSLVAAKDIECPKCKRYSPVNKVTDKYQ